MNRFDAEGWRRIRLARLAWLITQRGWRWEKTVKAGRPCLMVVSPRGVKWRFRLQRGAWIRKEEQMATLQH